MPKDEIEQKIPPPDFPAASQRCFGAEGNGEKSSPQRPVNQSYHGVNAGQTENRRPSNPEKAAHQDVLDRLTSAGSAVGYQNRGGGCHDIHDPDDRLLRHGTSFRRAGQGERARRPSW